MNLKESSRRRFLKSTALISGTLMASPLWSFASQEQKKPLAQPDEDTDDFFDACKKGDLIKVRALLATQPQYLRSKNQLWQSGFTVALLNNHKNVSDYLKSVGYETDLHESVLDLDWKRFNELLGEEDEKTSEKANEIHPMGGSAMWAAAAGGAGSGIWRVYAANGNPNIVSSIKSAQSPLQVAIAYHDLKTAEMTAATLLSNNTDPNLEINQHLPPLHLAAARGSTELLEMLVRLGADVHQLDQQGKSAQDIASFYGQQLAYDLLKNHHEINRTCRTSRYAYTATGEIYKRPELEQVSIAEQGKMVGSSHRDPDRVTALLSENPLLAHSIATTSEGAIEAGAHMGNHQIVDALLTAGAPYSLPTAVMLKDFSTVKKLLAEDENRIHERGAHDFPLLWYVVIGGSDLDMAELLIDKGAQVEEQHFLGTTTLHWACMFGDLDMVEFLIEKGADINRKGRKFGANATTPLQLTKDEKVRKFLTANGAN